VQQAVPQSLKMPTCKTRETVVEEARKHARMFTVEEHGDVGPPLQECLPSGLFYLIRDGKDKILFYLAFLDDPKECWTKLKDLEANRELQKRMGDAFSD
jgi:hypothetical protein